MVVVAGEEEAAPEDNNNHDNTSYKKEGVGFVDNGDNRFGGLANRVESSMTIMAASFRGGVSDSRETSSSLSLEQLPVNKEMLSELSNERTRLALANCLETALSLSENKKKQNVYTSCPNTNANHNANHSNSNDNMNGRANHHHFDNDDNDDDDDLEAPSSSKKIKMDILSLIQRIKQAEAAAAEEQQGIAAAAVEEKELQQLLQQPPQAQADHNAQVAATVLTTFALGSNPEKGLNSTELAQRRELFGWNAVADKELDSFLKLCWEAVQDFVLIMLILLGIISIVVELIGLEENEKCGTCWIEGAAILMSVCIVVLVTASIDYAKQFAFIRLTKSLDETNTKSVIRNGGQPTSVVDADLVVGDILNVNSHNLATIPADCVLLGPATGEGLKMDESTLTGESALVSKKPGDVILSGTTAVQGQAKMVIIAVGIHSVAGKIQARVYESQDHQEELEAEDGGESPLFTKLTLLAKQIGIAGTIAAFLAFAASTIIGLGIEKDPVENLVDYFIVAVTVLAVAVPEGLPLAVTLALAFSSNKMMKDMNLVKHLDACETMGCATTICTDKTGTLTANKMTARSLYMTCRNFLCTNPAETLGATVVNSAVRPGEEALDVLTKIISINTMNESVLYFDDNNKGGITVTGASGNPTEVALLHFVADLGLDYRHIRNTTRGRSDQGELGEFLAEGKQFGFSSARKMMSWVVPLDLEGGYRLYSKGASEVILGRCVKQLTDNGEERDLTPEDIATIEETVESYARRGMRILALAYRNLPASTTATIHLNALSESQKDSDGSPALRVETELTFCALVGIEDPLRPEVPGAIQKCYEAGIDVRLVTGDAPNTAVSIAYQAGILKSFHFTHEEEGELEMVASNLKPNVLLQGKAFRNKVYRILEDGTKEFDQTAFDAIWPHLRVLARSSPDDKLTLAHGLNQSTLFSNEAEVKRLRKEDDIIIFPDRQVIAMTGDGTNDAPALKRADIGFAMGIAGTQIAKDAADIILLDDNFASIVTAAKWGRNVYASIQKFLQFQLTVNISAVVTALVGAFAYQTSPLAAIQLLWVNLLMDSLASLALASEPPIDSLLEKPPVNRSDHMITKRMWANMLGQASYQITVTMILLFAGPSIFGIREGHLEEEDDVNSEHYTIIFNAFVWMQLFNEINCRQLKGEVNVFKGILNNPLFCTILLGTSVLQVILVEFGSVAFHVADDGLKAKYWGICLAIGAGSLPVQQVINILFRMAQRYKLFRHSKKLMKQGKLSTQVIGGMLESPPHTL